MGWERDHRKQELKLRGKKKKENFGQRKTGKLIKLSIDHRPSFLEILIM